MNLVVLYNCKTYDDECISNDDDESTNNKIVDDEIKWIR